MAQNFYNRATEIFRGPMDTPHLIVRGLKSSDDGAVKRFCGADDGAFSHRWSFDFQSKDATTAELKRQIKTLWNDNLYLFMFRKGSGKIVGVLELHEDMRGRPRISYFTLPSERGNGYAFEAYKACFNRGVESGLLKGQVYAHTSPENKASQHFLRAAGFECRGTKTFRNEFYKNSYEVKAFVHPITSTTRIRQKIYIPR